MTMMSITLTEIKPDESDFVLSKLFSQLNKSLFSQIGINVWQTNLLFYVDHDFDDGERPARTLIIRRGKPWHQHSGAWWQKPCQVPGQSPWWLPAYPGSNVFEMILILGSFMYDLSQGSWASKVTPCVYILIWQSVRHQNVKWFIGAFVNDNYTQMSRPHQLIIQCFDDLNLHLLGARVAQQLKSLGRCEHWNQTDKTLSPVTRQY